MLPLEAAAPLAIKLTEPVEPELFLTLAIPLTRVAAGSGRTTARS
jgi:hypothetical protein